MTVNSLNSISYTKNLASIKSWTPKQEDMMKKCCILRNPYAMVLGILLLGSTATLGYAHILDITVGLPVKLWLKAAPAAFAMKCLEQAPLHAAFLKTRIMSTISTSLSRSPSSSQSPAMEVSAIMGGMVRSAKIGESGRVAGRKKKLRTQGVFSA